MKYKIRFGTVIDGVPYFIHHERTMTKEKTLREWIQGEGFAKVVKDSFMDRKGMTITELSYEIDRPRSFNVEMKAISGKVYKCDVEYFVVRQ